MQILSYDVSYGDGTKMWQNSMTRRGVTEYGMKPKQSVTQTNRNIWEEMQGNVTHHHVKTCNNESAEVWRNLGFSGSLCGLVLQSGSPCGLVG